MGFFKSTKGPQGPIPSLSIDLFEPPAARLNPDHRTVYRPSDPVSGTVVFTTPIPINPEAIELSLWGESQTWIRVQHSSTDSGGRKSISYKHYRDRAPLFTETVNILEKPRQFVPGQPYNLPFNFRMPESTNNNRTDVYKDSNDIRWTASPHPLPPSFFFGSSEDSPDNASITYGITARLICPGISTGIPNEDHLTTTEEILFQPLNQNVLNPAINTPLSIVPYSKPFIMQSSILTGQDPSTIGFRQRMHDRFSSSTPRLDFQFGIDIPDILTSGTEFKIRTSFRVLNRCSKVMQVPAIKFKILKLDLRDITFFRAPRDRKCCDDFDGTPCKDGKTFAHANASGWAGKEEEAYSERKTPLNAIPSEQVTVELGVQGQEDRVLSEEKGEKKKVVEDIAIGQPDYCEYWFTSRVPGSTPPSFTSFAVTTVYRVKVRARVECGDKKFEYEAEGHVREMGSCM